MPKILATPKNSRGSPLIRPQNVKKLEQAADKGDIAALRSLGKALEAKMLSAHRREAIAAAVEDLVGQVTNKGPVHRTTPPTKKAPERISGPRLVHSSKLQGKTKTESVETQTPITSSPTLSDDWLEYKMSFLLGPEFRGQYRGQVVEIGDLFILRDVKEFLSSNNGPLQLAGTFNTRTRRLRLQQASNRFESTLLKWRNGQRHDPRVKWVMHDSPAATDPSYQFDEIDSILRSFGGNGEEWIQVLTRMKEWLPWVSVELAHKIRAMTTAQMGLIRRSLSRANRYFGLQSGVYPWTPKFDEVLAELPIHSLYQFEPTTLSLRTLNALQSVHCSNLGHLAAFHPGAWKMMHTCHPEVWSRLALARA